MAAKAVCASMQPLVRWCLLGLGAALLALAPRSNAATFT